MVTSERKMNELISKQKAIDEIKEFQSQVTCDFSKDWLNGMDEGFAHSVNVIELIDAVEAIPIEWIEQYGEENCYDFGTQYNAITKMLEEWKRKEE